MLCDGEILQCGDLLSFDFSCTYIVVVSAVADELASHVLLNTHNRAGHYCHIADVHDRPRMLNEVAYCRYLAHNRLRELGRGAVLMRDPCRALAKLEVLLTKPASWWRAPRAADFAAMVLRAGGSSASLADVLPRAFASGRR